MLTVIGIIVFALILSMIIDVVATFGKIKGE